MQRQAQRHVGLPNASGPPDWRRKAARLTAEYRSGGMRNAAAFALRILSRAFAPWIALESRACVLVPWAQALALAGASPKPDGRIRARRVTQEELAEYSKKPDYHITSAFLRGLRPRRDICMGVFVDGILAAYSFLSVAPTPVDGPLAFCFPHGWVYVYKSFTHPDWRGRRLHGIGILQAIRELGEASQSHYSGLVALVATDNRPSLRAFQRLGFRATRVFHSLSVFTWGFCPGRASEGFEIRAL